MALMGTGEQRWATWTALGEGFSNLVASIWLGSRIGAIGVAYGTLIGAAIGVGLAIFFTFPRATRIGCERKDYLARGLLGPAVSFAPLAAAATFYLIFPSTLHALVLTLGFLVTGGLLLASQPLFCRVIGGRLYPNRP
jgi:O-antigen/teichoic acid export membrane protein